MYAAAEVNDHVGTQKESGRVMWKPRKDTSERSKPADSGMLPCQPWKPRENKFLLGESFSIFCYGSLWRGICFFYSINICLHGLCTAGIFLASWSKGRIKHCVCVSVTSTVAIIKMLWKKQGKGERVKMPQFLDTAHRGREITCGSWRKRLLS